jgi:sulfide:quinone oxidoreductase
MLPRVIVLGAGFAGLELTTRLSETFGDKIAIVLIDKSDTFVFGFSKLDVMFGRATAEHVTHRYADLVKPGVEFVAATIHSIDPVQRRVTTDVGDFSGDVLVVALGADLDVSATPGLVEGGCEFYTVAGAFELRETLHEFSGGHVVIGVTSTPFKCPPAPSEAALLIDQHLRQRGLRQHSEISLVMPFGVPIPPSPAASSALLAAFAGRGITWIPETLVTELDPSRRVAICADGSEIGYDLFLGVPHHRVPPPVEVSGLAENGWIPVDPLKLETRFPGVYAVGDVTSIGTPKAGVFAEGQAAVAASQITALINGSTDPATYDGHGICYLEWGNHEVARVDVTFSAGKRPQGDLEGPSTLLAETKSRFGQTRIRRWFDREWRPT